MDKELVKCDSTEKHIFHEINIARAIGILLVVIGHAFPDASSGIKIPLANYIESFIYSFHMPLFFFISGFLGKKVLAISKAGGEGRHDYRIKRCKRLLVPYLVMSFLYLPLKMIMASFANSSFEIKNIWKMVLGVSPNYELWFLYTLLILGIYTSFFLNKKNITVNLGIWFSIMIIIYIVPSSFVDELLLEATGIYYLLSMGFYYILGLYIAENYEKIKKVLYSNLLLVISLGVLLLVYIIDKILFYQYAIAIRAFKIITSLTGISVVMNISVRIMKFGKCRYLEQIGDWSMDIYILSAFIQPAIRVFFYNMLRLNYWIYTALNICCAVVGAIIISKFVVRKVDILKRLILGLD